MTDNEDFMDDEADESIEQQQKKKKKTETESIGARDVTVTAGFYAFMTQIGAPGSMVEEVLRNWRHLRGEGLRRALADFAQKIASRATAHVEVQIDKGKDYGLVQNIIGYLKSLAQSPDHHHKMDNKNRFDPK